jgi:hypothetical protein
MGGPAGSAGARRKFIWDPPDVSTAAASLAWISVGAQVLHCGVGEFARSDPEHVAMTAADIEELINEISLLACSRTDCTSCNRRMRRGSTHACLPE